MVDHDGVEKSGDGVEDANVHTVGDQQQQVPAVSQKVPQIQDGIKCRLRISSFFRCRLLQLSTEHIKLLLTIYNIF